MKKACLLFILSCAALNVRSQTNKIEEIDRYVGEIDSNISLDADFHTAYMVHSINFETNKRAIGKQYTTVEFYYPMPLDSVVETDKGTDFLYIYKSPVLVSIHYNIAASQNIVIKYYFDEGEPVYYNYYSSGAYGTETNRYYFNKDELIGLETKTGDINIVLDKDFTTHDLFLAGNALRNASEYKEMFGRLVKAEQIDK